jgi:glutamate racemase
MARNIPGPLRRQIESAVRKIVGNRTVTPAIKAAVIAPATAAALAIPGMQIYSPAVPIVLNEILNKMIKEAKKMLPNQSAGGSSAPDANLKNLKANLVKAKKATAQSPATADLVARLKAARTAAQAVTPEQRAANTARNDAAFAQRQTAAPAAGLAKFALPAAGLAALFFIMRKK